MRAIAAGLLGFLASVAFADQTVLSARSLGPVIFGAKLLEVAALLGESAAPEKYYGDESCNYVSLPSFPGTLFMVQDGIVTRADAAADVINDLGVKVGTPMADVQQAHPSVQIEPHMYDPDGYYFKFPTLDNTAAIVMEVGDGKVTDIRAGLRPPVDYVEGCL